MLIPNSFKDDKLSLQEFSSKLEEFLMVEHEFVEGSLVVSLKASFGSGKTTFLSMWKTDLEERRKVDPSLPLPIVLNAWESDYCGDPLLSILSCLLKTVERNESEGMKTGGLREAAKDIAWFTAGIASSLVNELIAIDVMAAVDTAKEQKKSRNLKSDFFSLYEEKSESLDKLKNELSKTFGGNLPKAIIFIDELDRCRPDYAINYLETVKHVFDTHGIIFVLTLDYDQLACSARALFGQGLRFDEYFRKFSQRSFSLPTPSKVDLRKLADHFILYYLENNKKRFSLLDLEYRKENIIELVTALGLVPRQIQEVFRIVGHVTAGSKEQRGRLQWCLGVGVILMACLKVSRSDYYEAIGRSKVSSKKVGEFLDSLLGKKKAYWWFAVFIVGIGAEDPPDYSQIFYELGFIDESRIKDFAQSLSQYHTGWGHSESNRFLQIYNSIEQAISFGG